MKTIVFLVLAGCCLGQICQTVPDVTPNYAYDEAKVAGYMIIAASKGFVVRTKLAKHVKKVIL